MNLFPWSIAGILLLALLLLGWRQLRLQRTLAALRDAAEVAAVAEAVPVPMWRRDGEGRIAWANPAYRALQEASGGGGDLEIGGPSATDTGTDLVRRARRSEHRQSASRYVATGEQRALLEFTELPREDGAGTIGYLTDASALDNAQAELERHIAAHDAVLENLQVAISIFGPDKRLKFFNAAYASLWGLDERFLSSEPSIAEVMDALRERRWLPEATDFKVMVRAIERRITSLLDPEEELLHLPDERTIRRVTAPHPFGGLVFADEDVTDRLALARNFNTLNAVQRETLDNLYEGIAVYGGDARLKLWNPAYARIWQLPADQLDQQPHYADFLEMTRPLHSFDSWEAHRSKEIERLGERRSWTERLIRVDGTAIDYAHVPLPDGATLFSYLDVTDSYRVERALLERNEALEEADRLKNEFVANVSYELRTPLNAIVGFSEILDQGYFGPLNERQREYSQAILSSSQRLISLVNDILDLASIEAGYMTLELEEVNVREMVDSLMTLSTEAARTRNLQMSLECPDGIGTIRADGRRLKQALFNIISNAQKFTPAGGTVQLDARRDGDALVISVTDSGVGIAARDQERVFGKFERGRNQRDTGAGLGLSLVKSLIEMHGGQIELASEIDRGTIVTIRLPGDEKPPLQDEAAG
ncbi:MAG: PAS-domain containing protein [Oceanibaculum nanhaiense]|uniref:sensor histidine kinase n=1 Tax=Oceanibaculum nanhaiense TaxID=1909734 RepID=UPI0025A35945|nr:PAS domain-containing sensor histidine kinase [Oceanibaculum nanhaiense]MDM7944753.1 PAS-domain containing protein [Oceanibaculum nanhaiense]